jgi:hypothetical protein
VRAHFLLYCRHGRSNVVVVECCDPVETVLRSTWKSIDGESERDRVHDEDRNRVHDEDRVVRVSAALRKV